MRGDNQDPLTSLLICRKADRDAGVDSSIMPRKAAEAANAMCPACTRPMAHVRTIWRAFQDDLHVFECRACNVSLTVKVPQH